MSVFDGGIFAVRRHGAAGFGFTLVELMVIIALVSILSAIGYGGFDSVLPSSRDSKRALDISVISEKLELYYETTPVTNGSTYPPTSVGTAGLATIIDNEESIKAPGQTVNSLVIASSNAVQSPTINQYIYQPLTRTGSRCTNASTALCSRYVLYYRKEISGNVIVVDSLRQQ